MKTLTKCPKCSGSGKVAFTVDNGICYKCEGSGFIGGTDEDIAEAIKQRDVKNAIPNAVKSIAKHISANKVNSLEDLAIMFKGEKKQFTLTSASISSLFETLYTDNYEYIFTCMNPSAWMLNNREMLAGKVATIQQIESSKIKVTINDTI